MRTMSQTRAASGGRPALAQHGRSRRRACTPVPARRSGSTQGYTTDPLRGRIAPRQPQTQEERENLKSSQTPPAPQRPATVSSETPKQSSGRREPQQMTELQRMFLEDGEEYEGVVDHELEDDSYTQQLQMPQLPPKPQQPPRPQQSALSRYDGLDTRSRSDGLDTRSRSNGLDARSRSSGLDARSRSRGPDTRSSKQATRQRQIEELQELEAMNQYEADNYENEFLSEDEMREAGRPRPTTKATQQLLGKDLIKERTGESQQMEVEFREVDPFNLWLWFELYRPPTPNEADMMSEILSSWFMMGRLGAFNGENLQVYWASSDDLSYMDYNSTQCSDTAHSLFHDMSNPERRGNWMRCWMDMGTADEFALDMLINSMSNFSIENMGIKKMCIGGVNADWPVPAEQPAQQASTDPMSIDATPMPDWAGQGSPYGLDGMDGMDGINGLENWR